MPIHFGVIVREGKHGLKLTRENYSMGNNKSSLFPVRSSEDIYADEDGKIYSNEWFEKQLKDSLKNFDLNMEYFSHLNHKKFFEEIQRFLKKNKQFNHVCDLNLYENKSGYYLMILDEYCQLYIGTTSNIKRRIRQHWTRKMPFDRLLFPMGNVEKSILPIDSFRAFDTTRIYAFTTEEIFNKEDNFIEQFSTKYVCNRLAGGKVSGGLLQAITMMKKRKLK